MARIGVFSREVEMLVSRHLSPEARQRKAAQAARQILSEAQQTNKRALGVVPPVKQFVDGSAGAPLESVNPDHGRIVFQFEIAGDMLRWIGEQLVLNSPVLTSRYRDSHVLLADGVEVEADGKIPEAQVYTFVNIQPYARKIERGESDQAPDGVFEVVAALAQRRFGNVARIRFAYRALEIPVERTRAAKAAERNSRNPAIVVTLR
jgi:hypothetical protein